MRMFDFRKHKKILFSLSLFALLFVVTFLFLLLVFPLHRQYLEIELSTDKGSILKVYWAANNERFSERYTAFNKTDSGRHTYKVYIDSHTFFDNIRIDPTGKKDTTLFIHSFRYHQPGHTELVLSGEQLKRLKPRKDIADPIYSKSGFQFTTTGFDPRLSFKNQPDPAPGLSKYSLKLRQLFINGISALVISVILWIFLHWWWRLAIADRKPFSELQAVMPAPDFLVGERKEVKRVTIALYFVTFGCAIYLATKMYSHFYIANTFGTPYSPYSDALLWFRGTLQYLEGIDFKTYRPTVNLFFGSIYSLFKQVNLIPLVGLFYFYLSFLVLTPALDRKEIPLPLLYLLFFGLFFQSTMIPLNIGQIMVDFLPMAFTLIAIIVVGIYLRGEDKLSHSLVLAGLLLIGIASAIRGVQLIGGTLLLLLVISKLLVRGRYLLTLSACIVYFFPIGLDTFLQNFFGAENNGLFSLFCFYHEPSHSYVKTGKYTLRALDLPSSEVVITYLRFLFSAQGSSVFFGYMQKIGSNVVQIVLDARFIALLTCAFFLRISLTQAFDHTWNPGPGFWKHLFLSIISIVSLSVLPIHIASWALLGICLVLIPITFFLNQFVTSMMFSVFIGSAIFFAMIGMPGGDRVLAGFLFCFPLGILGFLIEQNRLAYAAKSNDSPATKILLIVALGFPAFLYSGSFLFPPPPTTALDDFTSIKISNDPEINRSLHYAADATIFYTEFTDSPVGHIEQYREINCPRGRFNGSFQTPCTIQ